MTENARTGQPSNRVLHLVSDSTGETVTSAVKAAASLFETATFDRELHPFVRSPATLAAVADAFRARPGPVFFTVADNRIREDLCTAAREAGVPAIDILAPILDILADLAGSDRGERPGAQHRVDREYLDRVAAIDYAMTHDDGLSADRLRRAQVILVGVSRTSKTPTCIYLACQGIRAANVPLIRGEEPPPALFAARDAGIPIIGLTASPQHLAQIRRARLSALGEDADALYADVGAIRDEVTEARLFFGRYGIPVIDVTRRSIEETAASIRLMLRQWATRS